MGSRGVQPRSPGPTGESFSVTLGENGGTTWDAVLNGIVGAGTLTLRIGWDKGVTLRAKVLELGPEVPKSSAWALGWISNASRASQSKNKPLEI